MKGLKKGGSTRIIYIMALIAAAGAVFVLVNRLLYQNSLFTQPERMRNAPRRMYHKYGAAPLREGADEVLAPQQPEAPEGEMAKTPFDDYQGVGSWRTQFSNDLRSDAGNIDDVVPFGATSEAGYNLNLSENIPDPFIDNNTINELVEAKSRKELTMSAAELLPQETNDEWYQNDFDKARYRIGGDNLINTDQYHVGVDTQGSSLKIANYDIRPRPPNPKMVVSPWNNSSVEPDLNNKGGLDGF